METRTAGWRSEKIVEVLQPTTGPAGQLQQVDEDATSEGAGEDGPTAAEGSGFLEAGDVGFPVFWHHVNAPEEKKMDGHLYTNKGGWMAVVHAYIRRVCTELRVRPSGIGVIVPHSYQVHRLRRLLGDEHKEVHYQGVQRRVIIISTVLQNSEQAAFTMESGSGKAMALGLVYRKLGTSENWAPGYYPFNTVINRAQELLIIVGNAKVMTKDPSWKEMIDYCRKNGATVDMPSADEEQELEEY
uniref:RNA helicase n=1 Tax=Globodera pallida TaxID=36090 RepID=A0A183BUN0_GLOPA